MWWMVRIVSLWSNYFNNTASALEKVHREIYFLIFYNCHVNWGRSDSTLTSLKKLPTCILHRSIVAMFCLMLPNKGVTFSQIQILILIVALFNENLLLYMPHVSESYTIDILSSFPCIVTVHLNNNSCEKKITATIPNAIHRVGLR